VPESMHPEVSQTFPAEGSVCSPTHVLIYGLTQSLQNTEYATIYVEDMHEVSSYLQDKGSAVLVLGAKLTSAQALEILEQCSAQKRTATIAVIVLCSGPEPELFQKFVDEGCIYYLARKEIPVEQLGLLVASCVDRVLKKACPESSFLAGNVQHTAQLLDLNVRLPMQTNIASAAMLVVGKLRESVDASYVQCFVYDSAEDTLTPADALENKEVSYSAASGLTAFVARTGVELEIERVGADPRYDSDIDNPTGKDDARFVAQPILGTQGRPLAILTAVRGGALPPFSPEESRFLHSIAECAAPTFSQLTLQNEVQAQLTRRASEGDPSSEIFRQEALEYHIRSWDQHGDVLKTLPMWLRASYWIVLVLVLIGLIGIAFMPSVRHFFGKGN
jgi:CheY-like chemotaxis protein